MNLSFDGIVYVSMTTKKKKLLGEKMNTSMVVMASVVPANIFS